MSDSPSTASAIPAVTTAELRLIVVAMTINVALAALLLVAAGAGSQGTELALRMTARISLVYFLLAFLASPVARLGVRRIGAWLDARRRAFGVVFGLSMSLHVGFILRLYALHAPERPPMVTDTDFSIGIPGLVLVALMTLTSAVGLRRRIGELWWKRLHTTGLYFVWTVFVLCLVDSVSRKSSAHPVLAYHVFIAALLLAMTVRIAAAIAGRRNTRGNESVA